MGDANGVVIPVPNLGRNAQLITSAHTHGSYENFRNLKPSDKFDIPADFGEASEFANTKEDIEDPAFVVVPSGDLLQYFSDGYFENIPTSGVASDPNSVWGPLDEQYHPDLQLTK